MPREARVLARTIKLRKLVILSSARLYTERPNHFQTPPKPLPNTPQTLPKPPPNTPQTTPKRRVSILTRVGSGRVRVELWLGWVGPLSDQGVVSQFGVESGWVDPTRLDPKPTDHTLIRQRPDPTQPQLDTETT